MQVPFSCLPPVLAAIEATISPARLARFSRATGGDKHYAIRLYAWNARLCEEFYLPLQLAEVALRNAIAKVLRDRFGDEWYSGSSFTSLLTKEYQGELYEVVVREKALRGTSFTVDHVIGSMTFGFWIYLMTARYGNLIWNNRVQMAFPNAPVGTSLEAIRVLADQVRTVRNRIMHQFAIFDAHPQLEFQRVMSLVKIINEDTYWLLQQVRSIEKVINLRPKF